MPNNNPEENTLAQRKGQDVKDLREIRNVLLPNGLRVNLRLENGKIHSVTEESGWEPHHDAQEAYAIPGLIDPHVHSRVPGDGKKETWKHLEAAALQGGVTTLCDMPNTNPPITTREQLDAKSKAIGDSRITWRQWFGATPDNAEEIARVASDPRIAGVKLYMAPTTGDLFIGNEEDQRKTFEVCAKHKLLLAVHAEDHELMQQNRQKLPPGGPLITDHCKIRDTTTEVRAVERALKLARETRCKVYLCHLSTPEAVTAAYKARLESVRAYVEVCPHFLFLDDEKLQLIKGSGFYKTNPPLRHKNQVQRLRDLLISRAIDCIGSDHAPHTRAGKNAEKVYYACDRVPSGMPGVQTILPLMLSMVRERVISLTQLAKLTSSNAAQILGLPTKGKLEPGCDADLVLLDPRERTIIRHKDMRSKCGWTAFAGMEGYGVPKMVLVGGKVVYRRT